MAEEFRNLSFVAVRQRLTAAFSLAQVTCSRILVLLICLSLAGCAFFVAKPEVSLKGVDFVGADNSGVELNLRLAVTNPNSYALKMNGYSYSLLVSSLPLAKGESRESAEFAGNTTTDLRLPVKIKFRDFLEILKQNPDPEHIPYQLVAEFALHAPFGNIKIPLTKSGTLNVPEKYGRFLKLFK